MGKTIYNVNHLTSALSTLQLMKVNLNDYIILANLISSAIDNLDNRLSDMHFDATSQSIEYIRNTVLSIILHFGGNCNAS